MTASYIYMKSKHKRKGDFSPPEVGIDTRIKGHQVGHEQGSAELMTPLLTKGEILYNCFQYEQLQYNSPVAKLEYRLIYTIASRLRTTEGGGIILLYISITAMLKWDQIVEAFCQTHHFITYVKYDKYTPLLTYTVKRFYLPNAL